MSAYGSMKNKLSSLYHNAINDIKRNLFGANNERLDFLMDSFYKLKPSERNAVIGVIIAVIGGFVLFAFVIYISRLDALKSQLDQSFDAAHRLKNLKAEYQTETQRYDRLLEIVQKRTRGLRLKPFLEQLAREQSIQIEGLKENTLALSADNVLSDSLSNIEVDLRTPNISIPKLLFFLIEVERSKKFLSINNLQIRGRYGTKLFFDGQIQIRGYSLK